MLQGSIPMHHSQVLLHIVSLILVFSAVIFTFVDVVHNLNSFRIVAYISDDIVDVDAQFE